MKRFFILLLLLPVFVFAETMYSPTWGFFLDLPEGYEFFDGDGKDRFSFSGPNGAMFDLVVYQGRFASMEALINDANGRISNRGDADYFRYNNKRAAVIQLEFGGYKGWGLCVELAPRVNVSSHTPMLLALAYSPSNGIDLNLFHISALDSICPSIEERYYPGPISEGIYPRGQTKNVTLAGGVNATVRENDTEGSQALIEREFKILINYMDTPIWQEAWLRYYRFIYRDSWDRVLPLISALVRSWGGADTSSDEAKLAFVRRALKYVQGFTYERDFTGSDFLSPVTAILEARGNCDSNSMVWAMILISADIRAAMMVSRHYSHAMGLADIAGVGARFEAYETKWLVAETTANVDVGLIAQDASDPQHWIGIIFE